MRRSVFSVRGRVVAIALAVVAFCLGGQLAAQATEGPISGSQDLNVTVHYNTARYNSYPQNYMSAWFSGSNGGGSTSMGVRNTSGLQIARAANVTGSWTPFYNNSGGLGVSPGTFYMNVLIIGACGGSGCGVQNWHGGLNWNIRYY